MTFDRIEKTISTEDEIISNAKVFKDEPHFQYDIVNSNIPLYIDKLYYPLVMEFPYSKE